jgi:hypothetical protein
MIIKEDKVGRKMRMGMTFVEGNDATAFSEIILNEYVKFVMGVWSGLS